MEASSLLEKYYVNKNVIETDDGIYAEHIIPYSYIYDTLVEIEDDKETFVDMDYEYKTIDINYRNFDNCVEEIKSKYKILPDRIPIWRKYVDPIINDNVKSLINTNIDGIKLYLVGSSILQAVSDTFNIFKDEYKNKDYDIYCEYDTTMYNSMQYVMKKITSVDKNITNVIKTSKDNYNFSYNDQKMEIFGLKDIKIYDVVNNFYLPCIKLFYDGKSVRCLPSFLQARMTGYCINTGDIMFQQDPNSIKYKYYKRGFGFIFDNKKDYNSFKNYIK